MSGQLANAVIERLHWQRFFTGEGPESTPVTLNRDRVFILPTREGILFAALLLAMLLGAINYNNSMGFLLTFLLAGMAQVGMLHTYRNLTRLTFRAGRAPPVFAGDGACFEIHVDNPGDLLRYAVAFEYGGNTPLTIDIPAQGSASVALCQPAPRRGRQTMGRFTVATRFPLGLFRAWAYLDLDMSCLVYPEPGPFHALPPPHAREQDAGAERGRGAEDFTGLRAYAPGDSPRHIAWKAAARGGELLTKQFAGEAAHELWLNWNDLPAMDLEARLSLLCRWVLDAHAAGVRYGLRIPGKEHPPSTDEAHRNRCLAALALYGIED